MALNTYRKVKRIQKRFLHIIFACTMQSLYHRTRYFSAKGIDLDRKKQFDTIKGLCDNFISRIIFCFARLCDALFLNRTYAT